MIKNKFHFWVGVFCAICFVIDVIAGRDIFTLCVAGFSTIVNIAIGIMD